MKVDVYDVNGNVVKELELPSFFSNRVRKDLIKRAVLSEMSRLYQPKGNYRWAGMETSADYVGRKEAYKTLKNRGQARLPREFFGGGIPGRVRRIPSSVGGRRAHPPKPWKKIEEKINKKEWLKAFLSALSSTTSLEMVKERGHRLSLNKVPLVVVDEFESLSKTKDVLSLLQKLVAEDLERAKEGRKRLTGVRRRRKNRAYKQPKSLLIVVSEKNVPVFKAASNIPGVDVVSVKDLKVMHLAPGTHPGRLALFTEKAIQGLSKVIEEVVKNE